MAEGQPLRTGTWKIDATHSQLVVALTVANLRAKLVLRVLAEASPVSPRPRYERPQAVRTLCRRDYFHLRSTRLLIPPLGVKAQHEGPQHRGLNLPLGFQIPARLVLGITGLRRGILGMVLAGQVDSVGPEVGSFKEGDEVVGIDIRRFGTYAEYVRGGQRILIRSSQEMLGQRTPI